jgi:hypothetical protein
MAMWEDRSIGACRSRNHALPHHHHWSERGGVTWMRRSMTRRRLAEVTPLGGPSHILPMLGPFLVMRIHPGIGGIKERSTT